MKILDDLQIRQLDCLVPVEHSPFQWMDLYIDLIGESIRFGTKLGEVTFTETHPDVLGKMKFP